MSDASYAYQKTGEMRTARARLTGINASYKDLCEVCRNVRGRDTDYALEFLSAAAEGEKAIYFARHNKGKGHRTELGGKKGGWPIKSVKAVLGVVESAQANANKLGLGNTKIAHIIANKQDTFPRMSPKGRRIVHNYETAFVEVVLEESQKKADAKKKGEKKTAEAKKVDAPKTGEAKKADAPKVNEAKKNEAAKPVEAKKETKTSEQKAANTKTAEAKA